MGEHSETLRMLRRMDSKLDRIVAELAYIEPRLTALERQAGAVWVNLAGQSGRLDRIELRLDGIERRLNVVTAE